MEGRMHMNVNGDVCMGAHLESRGRSLRRREAYRTCWSKKCLCLIKKGKVPGAWVVALIVDGRLSHSQRWPPLYLHTRATTGYNTIKKIMHSWGTGPRTCPPRPRRARPRSAPLDPSPGPQTHTHKHPYSIRAGACDGRPRPRSRLHERVREGVAGGRCGRAVPEPGPATSSVARRSPPLFLTDPTPAPPPAPPAGSLARPPP